MNMKTPSTKHNKLNAEMLALVSAIIKYIDVVDVKNQKPENKAFSSF